jgi:PAS domain S-box-containing protein
VETSVMPRLLIFSLALFATGAVAQTAARPPRTIRVVMDNAYAPYSFRSDDGKLEGILVDQWKAWEKKTGIKVEIHAMDWAEALRRMRAGEFDVIDSIVETPERRAYFDFTPPYATIEASVFFRSDISGITDVASLKGFPVGLKAGDQHIDELRENGVTTVILFQNNDQIIEAAKQHKINVFVMDAPSALYLLNKKGIDAEFRHSAPILLDELRRAVRKGDAALLRTVTEGFAAIDPVELNQINEKWFGRTVNIYGRYLIYAGYATGAALLLIAILVGWNRTLRKRILQRTAALAESEKLVRQITESIHEVFWLTDTERQTMLYVSPAYEAVWGQSRESLYREPRSFLAAIHPDDRARVLTIIERDREKGFEVAYRVVRPDASIRWIRSRGFPIRDDAGRVYRVAGIGEDITERKQAEEKLRQSESQLAEAQRLAHVGSWNWDPRSKVMTWSDELYRIFGVQPEEFDMSRDSILFIHPDDRDLVMNTYNRAVQTREPYSIHYRVLRRDGDERIMHSLGQIVTGEDGDVVRVFGTSQDVTELKHAEEKLKSTSEQLRALFARLQSARDEEGIRIARQVHDELGSALTSLKWDLERLGKMLSDSGKPSQGPELKTKIETMLGLTDRTIDIVRRIASELRPSVLDVLGLGEALEWQSRQFQDRTGIVVHYESPSAGVRLNQEQSTAAFRIFQEALTNILRHANATRVDVTIAEGNGAFVLTISDNGRGIKEEEKSALSSIGLLGMRERAHLLGGDIDVTGVEGEGTTVTLRLPIG